MESVVDALGQAKVTIPGRGKGRGSGGGQMLERAAGFGGYEEAIVTINRTLKQTHRQVKAHTKQIKDMQGGDNKTK
jgi:hypothetical protein